MACNSSDLRIYEIVREGDAVKDSFVLYTKYLDNIQALSMEQRGMLFTSLMLYASGQEPEEMDPVTAMAFSFIKSQMDKDIEKYNETCAKRSEAGKLGGRPKKQEEAKKANGFSENQKKQGKAKKADNEYEYDNDNDLLKENTKRKVFSTPTVDDVRAYCLERNNKVDPQQFVDFYESKGWMIGKNKMKDWKAAVRTWERSETKTRLGETAKLTKDNNNFERRRYDMDALERSLIG